MLADILRESGYATYRKRLETLLGIPEQADDTQIHHYIVEGFPAQRIIELCEQGELSPLERDQIIPLRTLKTRLNKAQPLTVTESDRLFRSAHITAMAESIFGDRDKAKRWLAKPKERFDGQTLWLCSQPYRACGKSKRQPIIGHANIAYACSAAAATL